LQSFVDRRFKPSGPTHPHEDLHSVELRLELLEQRLQQLESSDVRSSEGTTTD